MSNLFSDFFSDYSNTLKYHGIRIPDKVIDKDAIKSLGLPEDSTSLEILTQLCRIGYKNKGIKDFKNKELYLGRIKEELEILDKTGLVDYILMVYDMVKWADNNDVPRGNGRGSIGNCVLAWLIGLGAVDPVEMGLPFTRFVNYGRVGSKTVDGIKYLTGNVADIDTDFCSLKLNFMVENYLKKKYAGKVCKVLTEITLSTKAVLKEVAKTAFNYEEKDIMPITSMVESIFGKNETIDETIKHSPEFAKWASQNSELLSIAQKLFGCIKNTASHASAYAISVENLEEVIPLKLDDNGEIISDVSKGELEKILIKLDCLGLKTLSIISDCAKAANYNLSEFDPYEPSLYENLQRLKQFPYGVFQLEGDMALKIFDKIRPKNFIEVANISAIARPGALEFIPAYEKFIKTGERQKLYEPIDEILKTSGNLLLFQEDLMKILVVVFKFSELEADDARKGIGKKDKDIINSWEKKLYDRGKELNIPEDVVKKFWGIVKNSGNYLFAAGHCYNYNYLSLLTFYLKNRFPLHFYKAVIKLENIDGKLSEVINDIKIELDYLNIKLLPPKLNENCIEVYLDEKNRTILLGLDCLRGFSDAALAKLPQFISLDKSSKLNILEGIKACGLNITALSNLILSGCFDEIAQGNRQKLVFEAKIWHTLLTDKEKIKIKELAPKYNNDLFSILKDIKDDKLLGIMSKKSSEKRKSRFDNFYEDYLELKQDYIKSMENQTFDNYCSERRVLGYSFSNTLLNIFKPQYQDLVNIKTINETKNETSADIYFPFVGIIDEVHFGKSRKTDKTYAKLYLSDESATIMGFLSEETLPANPEKVLDKNVVVFCRCKKRKAQKANKDGKEQKYNNDAVSIENITILRKI